MHSDWTTHTQTPSKIYLCDRLKVWGQYDFVLFQTFIQQGFIKLFNSDSKDMSNVTTNV